MNATKVLSCLTLTLLSWLMVSGCRTTPSLSSNNETADRRAMAALKQPELGGNQLGADVVFTNANVTMWVPTRAVIVRDGNPTSYVAFGEITPPEAFVKDYRVVVEIQIKTPREFGLFFSDHATDWYFQEHPTISVMDGQVGKQLRKDLRDDQRNRILVVNAMVKRSGKIEDDFEMAKRMVETIKLIEK